MPFVEDLVFGRFMPHGHCYFWTPGVLWSHAASEAVIALSYFSIPVGLLVFARRRADVGFRPIFQLFATFILACGFGHLVDLWNIWHGAYWLSGAVRVVTALASLATATALWPMLPQALAIPSGGQLRAEISERIRAERELRQAHEGLEDRVSERTRDLEAFTALAVDREDQMIALKQRINELCQQAGLQPEHDLSFVAQTQKASG